MPINPSDVTLWLSAEYAKRKPKNAARMRAGYRGLMPMDNPTAIPNNDAWEIPSAMNPIFLGIINMPYRP